MAAPQQTRRTVAAFLSQEALARFGVDLLGRTHGRHESIHEWPVTPVARGLATEILRPGASAQALRFRSEALVLELLAGLQEQAAAEAQPLASPLQGPALRAATQARDIIAADPSADHTLLSIASAVGVSVTTLKRDFRKAFATSPIAFLRERRLERGRVLIEREGLSVSSAAYACGYDHPGNFAQAFRRKFGFAPSALRR